MFSPHGVENPQTKQRALLLISVKEKLGLVEKQACPREKRIKKAVLDCYAVAKPRQPRFGSCVPHASVRESWTRRVLGSPPVFINREEVQKGVRLRA